MIYEVGHSKSGLPAARVEAYEQSLLKGGRPWLLVETRQRLTVTIKGLSYIDAYPMCTEMKGVASKKMYERATEKCLATYGLVYNKWNKMS